MKSPRVAVILLFLASTGAAWAAETPSAFDPSRHMRVSEVKRGMKGYGLSVFKGTTIERFDVEVLSILHNFNPKHDVILIKCKGANLEHTGSIAGMSGSPIYLRDDQGRDRMIGAFAYGWPLMKDPVAGVQPIEYMLSLPEAKEEKPAATASVGGVADAAMGSTTPSTASRATGGLSARAALPGSENLPQAASGAWSLDDCVMLPGMKQPPARYPLAGWNRFAPNPQLGTGADQSTRMQPLSVPLMTAGMSPQTP